MSWLILLWPSFFNDLRPVGSSILNNILPRCFFLQSNFVGFLMKIYGVYTSRFPLKWAFSLLCFSHFLDKYDYTVLHGVSTTCERMKRIKMAALAGSTPPRANVCASLYTTDYFSLNGTVMRIQKNVVFLSICCLRNKVFSGNELTV